MRDKAESAKHYCLRAEEVRMIAQGIFDQEERKELTKIADEFEELALNRDVCERYLRVVN
jgi:predicted aldo/keto reductase-like oxidoreductase